MRDVVIVHYCYMVNDWYTKLINQLKRVYVSGLYKECTNYYLVVTDVNNEKFILDEILKIYSKITLLYYPNNQVYEGYAIQKIYELGLNNSNLNILYLQVRGITNTLKNFNTKEPSALKKISVTYYVEMLEYFLVDNWKVCLDKLNNGYHMVGVNCIHGMWWGNMWWVSSDYLKTNEPYIIEEPEKNRWRAESWVVIKNPFHATPEYKSFEFYKHWCDTHYSVIPKYLYDGTDRNSLEFTIHKAEYGYFAEAQHEHQPMPWNTDYIVDVTNLVKSYISDYNIKFLDIYIDPSLLPKITFPKYREDIGIEVGDDWWVDRKLKIYYSTNEDTNVYVVASMANQFPNIISKIII